MNIKIMLEYWRNIDICFDTNDFDFYHNKLLLQPHYIFIGDLYS